MATVECHGCHRLLDDSGVLWMSAFGGTERTGEILGISPTVTKQYHPGAVPYCPKCIDEMMIEDGSVS